jgi:hypothetical protein
MSDPTNKPVETLVGAWYGEEGKAIGLGSVAILRRRWHFVVYLLSLAYRGNSKSKMNLEVGIEDLPAPQRHNA